GRNRARQGRCGAVLISATHRIATATEIRRGRRTPQTAPERISASGACGTLPDAMNLGDAEITALAEKYSSVRVLCAGDVMLDRFIYGDVRRISPEAPIPVFSVREERSMLGGAGNVARNIAALGAAQCFIAVVGQDEAAEEVIRELLALENCEPGIVEEPARRTSVKTRYLAHQQQMLRVDSETAEPISEDRFQELLERFRAALPSSDIVVLSD